MNLNNPTRFMKIFFKTMGKAVLFVHVCLNMNDGQK